MTDPMTPAEADAHAEATYRANAGELQQIVERLEQTEAVKQDAAEAQKDVYADAKARGYSPKVLRKVVALRKRTPDDIAEEAAVLDMYTEALGM